MTQTTFRLHDHHIDLDVLYRAMYDQSELEDDGTRIYNGNKLDVRAVKRLLNELFDVPVTNRIHPVNNAIRAECRDRLHELGWATKFPGRSAKYTLLRPLSTSGS